MKSLIPVKHTQNFTYNLPVATLLILLAYALFFGSQRATAATIDMPPELRQLTLFALENNQNLQSMAEQVSASLAEIQFAGALENPQLTLGVANLPVDTFDLDQEPMTQKQVFISQKIPWFGKLSLKERIAALGAKRLALTYQATQLALVRKISEIWYDLAFTDYSLTINTLLADKVNHMISIAETRYATGKGQQQDILAGQIQLSEILEDRTTFEGKKDTLLAEMAELLNSEKPYAVNVFHTKDDTLLKLPARITLVQKALNNNPKLLASKVEREQQQLQVDLAKKEYGTDMNFRLGYGQREDDPFTGKDRADFLSASVTLSIPLWQNKRQDSRLAAEKKRYVSAQKTVASYSTSLQHRIDKIISAMATDLENHELFKNAVIFQAEQRAAASLASYSVGKLDFNTMLMARVQALRFILQSEKYRYLVLKKQAELNELIGEPAFFLKKMDLTRTNYASGEMDK